MVRKNPIRLRPRTEITAINAATPRARRRFLIALAVKNALSAVGPLVWLAAAAGEPGIETFQTRCSVCHGADGGGTERAPSLIGFIGSRPDRDIADLIRKGRGAMPAHTIDDPEMIGLIGYLHTLQRANPKPAARRVSVQLDDGSALDGTVLNESAVDLQLATADGQIFRLERDGNHFRRKPLLPKADWPRYDGSLTSNRHSPLSQINTANVKELQLQWTFPVPGAPRLEATPIVVDGVMYATSVNSAFALDASDGRKLWSYSRSPTPGLLGEAAGGANRGVAIAENAVFMMTDNAHLLALDKDRGTLLWDTPMTDWPRSQYSATGAPLVIGQHVVAGVAGGEEGARGFLASYDARTGKREWQFWTVPLPGEPLAKTWVGAALEHGCGATWMSGSYDPTLDLIYWAVGNPCPDFNGSERGGDNLYTDSVVALAPGTGQLKWYFQFTPHDTHDWDAAEPLVLVDARFQGRARQLLVQANRNGFFFVLDRTNGTLLHATPFVSHVSWASGFAPSGKPILLPNSEPTEAGTDVCPASATNWMSASYDPDLNLFFVAANDRCKVTTLKSEPFEMGKRYINGTAKILSEGERSIRALDLETGRVRWDYPQVSGGPSSSGTLSTAGALVFTGEDSGLVTALDARSGRPLWHFPANDNFRASPMTYMVGGRQFVSIASQTAFLAFALPGDGPASP